MKNELYNPSIFKVLEDKFLPYFFICSGLVLRDTGLTRITNGCIERHHGCVKFKSEKNVLPHTYIIRNYDSFQGQASGYLQNFNKVTKKRKFEIQDSADDSNKYLSQENWSKKRDTFLNLQAQGDKNRMGYQKNVDVSDLVEKNNTTGTACKLVITIKGINVYQNNLESLVCRTKSTKAWLHDNTIEAYAKMHANNALLIPTFTVDKIFQGDYSSIFSEFFAVNFIYGIRHINENHWNCFVVNFIDSSFIYIDPRGNCAETVTSALNHWRYICLKY